MHLFSQLTGRKVLIVAHDLLATAAAILASFYIRFEEVGLAERWRGWSSCCRASCVYAGVVYQLFGLYKAKWRFASLPDLYNIFRAATVLAVSLLVLDYVLVAPQCLRHVLLRQDHDRALLVASRCSSWAGRASPIAISAITRTRSTRRRAIGRRRSWCWAAPPTRRCCCAPSRAARSRRSGRSASCRRRLPTRARRCAAFRCSASRRSRAHRSPISRARGTPIARLVLTPSALEPEAQPETILMRARRLGLATSRLPSLDERRRGAAPRAGRGRGPAAAAEREDRLPRLENSCKASRSW